MDEEIILGICFLVLFLSILTSPLWITACIAAAATRKWSKEKTRRAHNDIEGVESDRLVEPSESENEEDFLDSEDEDYYRAKQDRKREERQEREADLLLGTRAKFFKEWKKCWKTGDKTQLAKERELKEQDERRKIAMEAVREYLRKKGTNDRDKERSWRRVAELWQRCRRRGRYERVGFCWQTNK